MPVRAPSSIIWRKNSTPVCCRRTKSVIWSWSRTVSVMIRLSHCSEKKIIKNDKTIDRKIVSDVVFAHEEMRQKLDHIIHPAVKRYILDEIEVQQRAGCPLMVVEAALLLEDHYDAFCDKVWYIHTDREIRIERLMSSRGYTREKAGNIIARQATEEFFREHADYIIQNNGDLKETWSQIEEGIRAL